MNLYIYMNYLEKYLKYKKKYVDLRITVEKKSSTSEINIIGGMECIENRVFANYLGTCWAIAVQTIITFGDVTSNKLEEIMNSFKVDDDFSHNIVSKGCFIKGQIKKVQNDCELKQAFPPYIFNDEKITNLKNILESFIDRYYSKIFNIKNKPIIFQTSKTNVKRCELVIVENFKKLFNLYDELNFGNIVEEYLIANILSTFFLGYKVSFTNYYKDDFSNIEYNDETDIGIIIKIDKHFCCFFICNGNEKYYNDNDKKIYNCNWKKKLKELNSYSLYVKNESCPILLNEKSYRKYKDKKNIFKVHGLTVVSKYNSSNSNKLDTEIQNIFNKTNLDKIQDKHLQEYLADIYYYGNNKINLSYNQDYTQYVKYVKLTARQNSYISQNNLGLMYRFGDGVQQDFDEAIKYFKLAADQNYSIAQNNLGLMYYNGYGVKKNYAIAKKYFQLAAEQNNQIAKENLVNFNL